MTESQLNDWLRFHDIEPIGGPGDDYRAAQIAWACVMPHTGNRHTTIDQYLPIWGGKDPLDPAEYKARALARYRQINTDKEPK